MKAACYLEGFATHQYFSDGNKRTGVMCCITFLLINGYEIDVDDESLELYHVAMKVCDDSIPRQKRWGIEEVAVWLQKNCIKNMDFT
ncbi:hypothetical protein GCM10011346_37350 [Oceanobacillus neutriphilus]|uniref:Fido domain-containing protein n=1 Tax=Oceanobacillus neutriphilus TaxID=531815 RepID=A0ABQ2NZ55_9BACI|nr:Fic family protein [Oceanobacillus neutriphilus]GGP14207.1 hypothetical protein GCM10011346_37350 [Oceanobacillus neutriphilus]